MDGRVKSASLPEFRSSAQTPEPWRVPLRTQCDDTADCQGTLQKRAHLWRQSVTYERIPRIIAESADHL
jgi:hypothetical protein